MKKTGELVMLYCQGQHGGVRFKDIPEGNNLKKTRSQEQYLEDHALKVREQVKKLEAEK